MLLDLRSLLEGAAGQTLVAAAAVVQLVAPAPTVQTAVTLQPPAAIVRVQAPAPSLAAAVTLSPSAASIQIRAPAATLVAGAVVLEEIPAMIIFAENLIETALTVTVQPPAAPATPLSRLFDRDKGPQYQHGGDQRWAMPVIFTLPMAMGVPTQTVIDIDLGSAKPVSGWALVNHAITATVRLYADATFPPTTERTNVAAVSGVHFLKTFGPVSFRYWRVIIPTVTVAIGEMLLGTPRVLTEEPILESAGTGVVGNVGRDRSRSGYLKATRRGIGRGHSEYGWDGAEQADRDLIMTAFTDADEGAKKVLLLDATGQVRWCDWLNEEITPKPIGKSRYEIRPLIFEDSE